MLLFNIALGTTGFFDTTGSRNAALGFIILWVAAYGLSAAGVGECSRPFMTKPTHQGYRIHCLG